MKTILKFLIYNSLYLRAVTILFLFITAISCDDFVDVSIPQSELTGAVVYQDVATAKSALVDIYARFRESGVASGTSLSGTSLMANYSDDMDFYGSNANIEQFNKHNLLASNTTLLSLWNTTYSQIYAINALLEGIESSQTITGDERNRLVGEAKFLRAFAYFYLVNIFGDIPYVTSTDYKINSTISKTTTNNVYQNIINDLVMVVTLLPDNYASEERVRINKAGALAMLSRIYLYTENYHQAEDYATLVINSTQYAIELDPSLVFKKENPSIIWAFHPGSNGQNTKDASAFAFFNGPPNKPSLSQNLYNEFEPGDLRKTLWIMPVTSGTNTWYRPYKYKQVSLTSPSQEYSIVLRLEEQFLIRAEARARVGNVSGAQEDLNIIRNRAGLPDTSALTQQELVKAILKERRFEFFTEQSHRWFDLKRTGTASNVLSTIKPGWQETNTLLPLPESELLLNENLLPQNPGY